ncbi:MAG TPA: hypothetical protein VHP12_03810 [Chitinophagaceae bacterium]|nr:hypothetical protein [Chitinophagaceae bacterium]
MKFITAIILTALLSFTIGLFTALPWWSFAITTLIIAAAIHQKPWKAFLAAFVAQFVLWAVLAFIIDIANQHLLSVKVATILPLHGSYILLIFITAFIGALVAGLSALTGSFLRKR